MKRNSTSHSLRIFERNDQTFNYFDLYPKKLTAMGIGFFSYEGRGIRVGIDPPRYETIDWEIYNTRTLENKVRDVEENRAAQN